MTEIAVVTGGAGKLGVAICRRLRASGYDVISASRSLPATEADAVEDVEYVQLDVTDTDGVEELFDRAAGRAEVRGVVCSHGIARVTPLAAAVDADIAAVLDTNLGGVVRVCRAAAARMQAGGSIVTLSSVAGHRGRFEGALGYGTSKAAIEMATKYFAAGVAARGIRVNCVVPGFGESTMGSDEGVRAAQGGLAKLLESVPIRRAIKASEVAEVVEFLLSDRASAVTGVALAVDGGLLAAS